MAHMMQLWISEMYYTLFDGLPELLNANCVLGTIKLDYVDGQFLLEPHLLIRKDTINISLQLISNVVHFSETADGGFSLSIG